MEANLLFDPQNQKAGKAMDFTSSSVLLCTLGTTWTVVPEVAGIVWRDKIPIYQNDPPKARFEFDNPGINRTTLVDEYLTLARMDSNLTLWETLNLVKQGFANAFLDENENGELLKRADVEIFRVCREMLG